MYHVYILHSQSTNRYYIGCTNNLTRRFSQHQKGYPKSTRPGRPWIIIHKEIYPTLSKARQRERFLKNLKSRVILEKYIIRS
ncbi:MAG: GIY-YIG nuclease family protein [Patescibacteria group bacterium]